MYIYATGCGSITGSDYLTYKPHGAVLNTTHTLTYTRSIVIYPPLCYQPLCCPSPRYNCPDIPLPYIKIETKDSITQYFDIDVASPLARRIAIQSRGTAVFAARMSNPDLDSNSTTPPWSYVVKEHWRARPEDTEAAILQSVGSIEVVGLPLYHFHQDMGRYPAGQKGL